MSLPIDRPEAKLVLRDGSDFTGKSFGAAKSIAGEVVFATGMVGYPESMTDPSYHGQILVLTSPMIGNYGVPKDDKDAFGLSKYFESQNGKIHVSAVIVSENCDEPVHWQKYQTLHEWLEQQGVPGLMMVDTRSIVLKLREMGTALGKIVVRGDDIPFFDPNTRNLVDAVSTKKKMSYGHGNIVVLCFDMGVKLNTIRCFLKHDVTLVVVPHDHDITTETFDGLFISNGPGNPQLCTATIRSVRWALDQGKPIFGICMGNQVLSLAAGGRTFKMKYGHRGQNQPCRREDGRVLITTQNHGFAVDMTSLDAEAWVEMFSNPNDKSNEGIRHRTKPYFAVQFHPEGRCGPQDTEYLFRDFVESVKESKIEEIKRTQPRKVLVLGAGGITIAQAGEFDYSGSQCLKSLREEGIKTVLINPNIATVQTDDESADQIYFCPVNVETVENVIAKERPDGILLGWGGQTALNCGVQLQQKGVLQKYNCRVLGTQVSTIQVTEDRELFRDALLQIDEHVARSAAVTSVDGAVEAAKTIGFPVMVRAAFCLGGQGSGIVKNVEELVAKVSTAFAIAPQVLIEESVAGWKEIEYEVVRDIYDNCITVCNMENFDPMGVHTGESIVVAPSQTLTNDEYHMLRTASIKIIRHLGVVGECNVQYGLDPKSSRYVVIEVNARLSRSSALASKATGYPLAHVAAKLALGKGLDEITNGVTKSTTACFEPSLDYIVVKAPRWDLTKFNLVSDKIGSMMKSVGEVMAIGRTFEESMQKALRMVDNSVTGFEEPAGRFGDDWDFEDQIRRPTPNRIFAICRALHRGVTVEQVFEWSQINLFFLKKLRNIVVLAKKLAPQPSVADAVPAEFLRTLKCHGFSDKQIAARLNCTEEDVRGERKKHNIMPAIKQIDTVAGEFPAAATYLYCSYNAQHDDVPFGEPMHVVLGCGVYRIGNSVEFDYCGVLVARELRRLGHKVIMINYNPETVSTDYDECDRLYFEEVSEELVLDILEKERTEGIVISVGGQLVQNMALSLKKHGLPVLGTDPENIDMAEDRNKFSRMCDTIGVPQPSWISAKSLDEVHAFCDRVGFPALVRPSYVLSGSAMSVIWSREDVDRYLTEASRVSGDHPVVVSKYHRNSTEYDVDVVAHHGKILCYSICEHVENAGVHSGDATMLLPPRHRDTVTMKALHSSAAAIAEKLDVVGPMNVQFLLTEDGELKVIEANVRCSRSIPFVSKTLGISFPAVMVSAFLSKKDSALVPIKRAKMTHVGCKAAMFSFNRLAGADPILGVEMASTGEVGVFGRSPHEVILKAMLCQNIRLPKRNVLISIDREDEAAAFAPYAAKLSVKIYATPIAAAAFAKAGIEVTTVTNPGQETEEGPNASALIEAKEIDMVIQLRDKAQDFLLRRVVDPADAPSDYHLRRLAIDFNASLLTEAAVARLFCEAIEKFPTQADLEVEPFGHYVPKVYHKLENNNCTLLKRHKVGLCVDHTVDSRVLALRLKKEHLDVTCFHADLGQQGDPSELKADFAACGVNLEVVDLRDSMAEACFDMVLAMGVNDNDNWHVGGLGRYVIGAGLVKAMRTRKMTVVAQTSGRQKREMRFEKYVKQFCPEMAVYSPWRDTRLVEDFPTDAEKRAYLTEHGMVAPEMCPYTVNANIGGAKYTASVTRFLPPPRLTKLPRECPEEPEFVTLGFRRGRCVQINGQDVNPLQALGIANELGGRHGLGLAKTPEGEMYETPGMALLARGLRYVYDAVFDRSSNEIFRTYSNHVAAQTNQGLFGDLSTQSALAAIRTLASIADGTVTLELHRGQAIFLGLQRGDASASAPRTREMQLEDVFMPGNGSYTDIEW